MPRIPTKIAVTRFNPIWKFHIAPIIFMKNIKTPPSIEFSINLKINFNGIINNLPNKKIIIIPAKYASIVPCSKLNHLAIVNTMTQLVQIY